MNLILNTENKKLYIRYLILFVMLLCSIASLALTIIISTESKPFFYAGF